MKVMDLSGNIKDRVDESHVIYVQLDPERGSRGRMSSIMHELPRDAQSMINLDGCRMHATLGVFKTVLRHKNIRHYNSVNCLLRDLQTRYPHIFTDVPSFSDEAYNAYRGDYHILETYLPGAKMSAGYHRMACPEPLILEPEDWSDAEWATLCKLCGLKPAQTDRIKINVDSIETYLSGGITVGGEDHGF